MKVKSLSLKNFRGFEGDRRFPSCAKLSDGFVVIAGINGRGKTSLLDGLALLLSRLLRGLGLSGGVQRTLSPSDVFSGQEEASLSLEATCAGIPVTYRLHYRPSSKKIRASELLKATRDQIRANYGDPEREDDQAPVAVYFTTDRAGYRLPRSLPPNLPTGQRLAHHGALSNRMVDYRDFMARYRLWVAQENSAELSAFNRVLSIFLDGFSDVSIEERPLRMTVNKAGKRLSLQQLSDGERSFIAMLGDLVRRLALANPLLADPLQGHGVVLIDELELHLHPRWQREVVEKLRASFPNIQFITTTHSPFVIQSLRPGELITLDPDEFGEYADKSIEDIAEDVMGVDVPQKSKRYLEMMKGAEEYFRLLQKPEATPVDVSAAEDRFNELSMRYSKDPAFHALLKLEREAKRARGGNATG